MSKTENKLEQYVAQIDAKLQAIVGNFPEISQAGAYYTIGGNIVIDICASIDGEDEQVQVHSSIVNLHTEKTSKQVLKMSLVPLCIEISSQRPLTYLRAANIIPEIIESNTQLLNDYLIEHKNIFGINDEH